MPRFLSLRVYALVVALLAIQACRSTGPKNALADGEDGKTEVDPNKSEIALSDESVKAVEEEKISLERYRQIWTEVYDELMKDFGPQDRIIVEMMSFIKGRMDGKKGPALFRLMPGWPGVGKTFRIQKLVNAFKARGVNLKYYYYEIEPGATSFEVEGIKKHLRPLDNVEFEMPVIVFWDEAHRANANGVDAEKFTREYVEKVTRIADELYKPISYQDATGKTVTQPNGNRDAYVNKRLMKLEEDLKAAQSKAITGAEARQEAMYVIRNTTANNGSVDMRAGKNAISLVEDVTEALRRFLNAELESLEGSRFTEVVDYYRTRDRLQKEIALLDAEQRTADSTRLEEIKTEIEAKRAKLIETNEAIKKAGDVLEQEKTELLARTDEILTTKAAEQSQLRTIQSTNPVDYAQVQKLENSIKAADARLAQVQTRLAFVGERIDSRRAAMADVKDRLKMLTKNFPEVSVIVAHRIPEKYAGASPHHFFFEAMRDDPGRIMDLLRKKASTMQIGNRLDGGNTFS